jgi:hypothetical protein
VILSAAVNFTITSYTLSASAATRVRVTAPQVIEHLPAWLGGCQGVTRVRTQRALLRLNLIVARVELLQINSLSWESENGKLLLISANMYHHLSQRIVIERWKVFITAVKQSAVSNDHSFLRIIVAFINKITTSPHQQATGCSINSL